MGLLTPDMVTNLQNYQYHGSDASLVLNHVYRPLLNRLILFFPRTMAPNLITLFGFCCISLGMVLACVFAPDFSTPLPRAVYLANGLLVFAYSMFDNLDGKQARRTMTSSALGELFDHGVDAIASSCIAVMWATALQLGRTPLALMVPFVIYAPFYTATWECYWVGGLHLGRVNGPIEGLLALAVGQMAGAFFGPEVFTRAVGSVFGHSLTLGQAITGGTALSSALYILLNVFTVVRHVVVKRSQALTSNGASPHHRKGDVELPDVADSNDSADTAKLVPARTLDRLPAPSVVTALLYLLPLILFVSSGYVWLIHSPPALLTGPVLGRVPGNILFVLAFLPVFAHLCSMMSLLHICKMPYRLVFPIQVPMLLAAANAFLGHVGNHPLLSGRVALLAVLLTEYVIQAWFYYRAITEISGGLRINVLTLTAEQLDRVASNPSV